MSKIVPCLWYDGAAEEAATFYTSLFPDGRIDRVTRAPSDNPSTAEGAVLMVEFTLGDSHYLAMNGGPQFKFTEAISLQVATDDQAETDRLWAALTADGGTESMCGWLKDRWGLSWQITPRRLMELVASPDRDVAGRVFRSMMTMRRIDIATLEEAAAAEAGHA